MFSFKKEIQKITSSELFNRGIKLYLEGGVIDYEELSLDYWRLYRINDTYKKETYFVKTPILHLALKDLTKVKDAIKQFVVCNCQYFEQENTPCKHIISVFVSLENEFNKTQTKSIDVGKKIQNGIFDQIQGANEDKKFNEWVYSFENWLASPMTTARNRFLADVKLEYKLLGEDSKFDLFFQRLTKIVLEYIKIWENEKRIYKIVFPCLLSSHQIWSKFWLGILNQMHISNVERVFVQLYNFKFEIGIYKSIQYFIDNLELEESQKKSLFAQIVDKSNLNFKDEIDTAFDFKMYDYIWTYKDELDPEIIFKLVDIKPEMLEEAEILVVEQIKQWLFLIQSGDYDKIESVFDLWYKTAGGITFNMSQLIDYIKLEYKKRRSLIKIISKYT